MFLFVFEKEKAPRRTRVPSVRRFPFRAKKKNQTQEDSFSRKKSEESERRFFRSRLERFRRAGAVSRFAKRRNRRGKRVECRKARNGSFRTDTRCEGGCGADAARDASVRGACGAGSRGSSARGARSDPRRTFHVDRRERVAQLLRRRERTPRLRGFRSERQTRPRGVLQTGVGHFLRVEVRDERARGRVRARGRHHGGARSDHRGRLDPPVARPRRRVRATARVAGGGRAGSIRFFLAGRFLASPPGFANREKRSCEFDKMLGVGIGRGGENLEKRSASTEAEEVTRDFSFATRETLC